MLALLKREQSVRFVLKPIVFILSFVPFLLLVNAAYFAELGADPAKTIVHKTGEWALRFLMLTLTISPLKKLLNWPQLLRLRRMLGLYAFFYGVVHFCSYYGLYLFFDWRNVFEDVVERPYITIGFIALLLMLPLTITSTQGWQRRLGRRWSMIHRAIYPISVMAVIHFYWQTKLAVGEPLIYIFLLSLLFGLRIYWSTERR